MKTIEEIYLNLMCEITKGGNKQPHGTSELMIRQEKSKYYFAMFAFFYKNADGQNNIIKRPEKWIIADLESGNVVKVHNCKDTDFSSADYETVYRLDIDNIQRAKFNVHTSKTLNDIRNKIINEHKFDKKKYAKYMNIVLTDIPEEYKRFYAELSNIQ